ncbi:MAG: hypothetical protein JSV03_03330, partial [Planctomycetota bacterium]
MYRLKFILNVYIVLLMALAGCQETRKTPTNSPARQREPAIQEKFREDLGMMGGAFALTAETPIAAGIRLAPS